MQAEKIIGIVGGVGPFAGLDLQQKILQETTAARDQDYLSVISISQPGEIPDRTAYLLTETAVSVNPAIPITRQLLTLERAGAQIAGIPCNSAHAAPIFDAIRSGLQQAGSQLTLLHMIDEVARFLRQHMSGVQRVGVLSTTGTRLARIYPAALEPAGFTVLTPSETVQTELIHPAIYDPEYGIKANGRATAKSRSDLLTGVAALQQAGAQAIILGCTEIPLALTESQIDGIPLVDATRVLARALIREAVVAGS
ncbi:MAG: aspartate/glutamate racemase family protein [Ardenticatenaceae bacterium]|nr:aspartate/glutamate racemase family protein [Ardenticatenaceae bacterium]MCB8991618.1 aspartate/glutamate racemase family protein [Ardenticatenaceae bacterium]MCB9004247.1 aspartate/glutamate racemase family protein [Ardenticatenaceae bacterium]